MSAAASSSAVKHRGKKAAQAPPPPLALALFSPPISSPAEAEANPGRIFYKCPNHHIPPNPCQHYYWEDGPDNYFDFLVRGGYVSPGLSCFDSAGVIASEETEVQVKKQSTVETVVYAEAMQKMNELIFLCRSILSALVVLIVAVVYVGFNK
uniref:Zinc finger GRF-type domain-containing protein n=1 Tax=Aegilops tauschii TaxID=37682 RepID=N1QYG5_AEGTA